MHVSLTAADLAAFEQEIADLFAAKKIFYPIHLSGGNEQQLIDIFEQHVDEHDWVCLNWRSHLHCLLKGVAPDRLKDAILTGHSIALCFDDLHIISSAIVGGMAPIAVGLAMGIQHNGEDRKVVCFLGDATLETGVVRESIQYAGGWHLPVHWVIEDNGLSVCSDTKQLWGKYGTQKRTMATYQYVNKYPHCGIGEHVAFP